MRLLFILAGIVGLATSCSTVKKASAPKSEQQVKHISSSGGTATNTKNTTTNNSSNKAPVFIENISFRPGNESGNSSHIEPPSLVRESTVVDKGSANGNNIAAIEVLPSLRFKYAILLDAPVEEMNDIKLLEFIDSWYGTRYRLGGSDKTGIDCSAFVQSFLAAMYGLSASRTCREQYQESSRITKSRLQEGDLVFFKTRGRSISHVGIYLRNNKFIHASTSSGVMISDLSDEYFRKRYAGAGRVTN